MKYAVLYQSETGSTKRVADAIAAALPGDVTPVPFTEDPDIEGADVVFVGFPMHRFGPATEAAGFLDEGCKGRRLALFVTHASHEAAPMLDEWLEKCRQAAAGCELVGFFHCQGELSDQMRQAMLQMEDPALRHWAETDQSQGQPDESRLQKAREFARQVTGTA